MYAFHRYYYDCQANFNFLPPSLIVDMRRAKFLCKIFTMENYDYSVIMKQAKPITIMESPVAKDIYLGILRY